MHIPDGFLSAEICMTTFPLAAAGLVYCAKKTVQEFGERRVPLLGVVSAFLFVAQMVHFPVGAGVSAHLLGAVLAAVLLGPYAGIVCLSVVLVGQCFILQDGGLTALGANILNMSFLGGGGGFVIFRLLRKFKCGFAAAVAVSAWFSVVLTSSATACELVFSGMASSLVPVLPFLAGIHAASGIVEGAVSSMIVVFVLKVRPDLVYEKWKTDRGAI